MSATPTSYRQLAAGVVLGLAVGLLLVSRISTAGSQGAAEAAAQQTSVVTLSALADLVSATRGAEGDVQAALTRFAEDHDDLVWARVVDIKKRELLASTVEADQAEGPLPRRLERRNEDHKAWYDLGQSLRAAIEANRQEGRLWKEEILVERQDDSHLWLAAPMEYGGDPLGVVVIKTRGKPVEVGGGPSPWLFLAGGAAVFLAAGALLRGRGRAPVYLAGAVVAATLGGFAFVTLEGLSAARLDVEEAVAQRLGAELRRAAAAGRIENLTPENWDADRFRRSRGIVSGDGSVDSGEVVVSFARARGRFRTGFLLAGFAAFGLAAFVGLGGAARTGRTLLAHREAYLFVAPAILGMLVLVFFPFFFGIVLSFTDQTLYNLNEPIYEIWVGFENYVKILTDFDVVRGADAGGGIDYENFYWTLWLTVAWTVTNVTIGVSVGMALALVLNTRGLAFKAVYRVLLILPWAVPNYITALIWKGMFHQQFGVVNQILQIAGFEPISWFDHTFTSFCAVVATNGWLSFPFMMVVALGGLQSIPSDLYEAARIDGANRWQQFVNVTLPSLKPVMVPAVILSVVWTFNMFNIIYLVSAGEPGHATEILITQAFKLFYEQYQYGYAAAYATVIFAILLIYGTWQNRVTRASEGV